MTARADRLTKRAKTPGSAGSVRSSYDRLNCPREALNRPILYPEFSHLSNPLSPDCLRDGSF
jgi:hypothetical protein